MEEQKTIFDYLGQVMITFGFSVAVMNVLCLLVGEEAREVSTIYSLGKEGLSVATMLQFLVVAVCITGLRVLFLPIVSSADVHYGADGVYVICGGCGDRDFYGTVWMVPGGYVGVVGGLFPDLWSVFCGQPYGHAFEGKGGEPEDGGGAASYQGDERQESL